MLKVIVLEECECCGVIELASECVSVCVCVCYVQAKSFHDELQDTLQQLSEIDAQLVTSQPVGGLPETARKQLEQLQVSIVCFCLMKCWPLSSLTSRHYVAACTLTHCPIT